MGRLDDLKKLKDVASSKLADETRRSSLARVARDAAGGATGAIEAAEAVVERSGLTKKNGEISKVKVAKAALRPTRTARTILRAAAVELHDRRQAQSDSD